MTDNVSQVPRVSNPPQPLAAQPEFAPTIAADYHEPTRLGSADSERIVMPVQLRRLLWYWCLAALATTTARGGEPALATDPAVAAVHPLAGFPLTC